MADPVVLERMTFRLTYECDDDNHDIGCQCPGVQNKLASVIALIDGWMEKYGPGTEADRVMGRQVVSIEFLHGEIHRIVD